MGRRSEAPTPRQLEVLAALKAPMKDGGPPANIRELADALGLASTNGVEDHLKALKRKGLVRHIPGGRWAWWPRRRAARGGA